MALRGTKKARSIAQEDRVAELYNGVRSPSSGGADNDQGDVRTSTQLIECKYSGGPEQDRAREGKGEEVRRSQLLRVFEKITLEAWTEDREPVMAIREWAPESKLANKDGWVDLTVRLQHEDVHRDRVYTEALASEAALNGG